MTNDASEEAPTLPGMEPRFPQGRLEAEVVKQVKRLRELGYVEDHHAGLIELATVTARDIDLSFGRGAPSGRANLLRVMNEILETLPHPEAASRDALEDVVSALKFENQEDDLAPLPSP